MSESFFINPQNKKLISSIYSFAGFNIHTDINGIKTSTKYQIHVDKLNGREFVVIKFIKTKFKSSIIILCALLANSCE